MLAVVLYRLAVASAVCLHPGEERAAAQRSLPVPTDDVQFLADSIRLKNGRVFATGNCRAVFSSRPQVELRSDRLEYRLLSKKVLIRAPRWSLARRGAAVGGAVVPHSARLAIRAASATYDVEDGAIEARDVEIRLDGERHLLKAKHGAFHRKKDFRLVLDNIQGRISTHTARSATDSNDDRCLRLAVDRAELKLTRELRPVELRVGKVTGVEQNHGLEFSAVGGRALFSKDGRFESARVTGVQAVSASRFRLDCDQLEFRQLP